MNFMLDPKGYIQNHVLAGCGQEFKNEDYKIQIQFKDSNNNNIQVRMIFFTHSFLRANGGKLELYKA